MSVRVRIAPAPTGYLHIGTARTALFNWLFAKKNKGKFILRIEDTDLERSDKKFDDDILESLKWLRLKWDELYRQSERMSIYKKYVRKLLDEGKAFWCYHSVEELETEKQEQMKRKEAPRHICGHKYGSHQPSAISHQQKGIIRLAVDENSQRVIHFNDIIRGTVEFEQRVIGDLSIAKDPDTPLYNFAAVIDDYDMKISHVIRGEDHIPNTPKQILISEALGFTLPEYAHLPLILGPNRTKLSKRHGAASIIEYKADYLPEALLNFMAFLGYTCSKEILSIDEMAQEFDMRKVHKSAAIFNIEKLNWINGRYIKKLSPEEFKKLVEIKRLPEKAIPLITERLEKLSDAKNFNYLWEEPEYDKDLLIWPRTIPPRRRELRGKKNGDIEQTKKALQLIKEKLGSDAEWGVFNEASVRSELDGIASKNFAGDRGVVYWPLRAALTGKQFSPDPVQIMSVLTKNDVFNRIEKALKVLSEGSM